MNKFKLKQAKLTLLIISSALFLGGCENTSNTAKGTGIGVVGGAVVGGLIGKAAGSPVKGALIGGAIGGVTGNIIGRNMDKQARKIEQTLPDAEVERVGEGIKLVLKENSVRFETGKSILTQQAKNNLDRLVPVFREYADTDIKIFGYTDNTGSIDLNLKLSEQRANSVKTYLIARGLSPNRFWTQGLGIAEPIADNSTVEGRSQNRRVEFAITANQRMIEQAERQANS